MALRAESQKLLIYICPECDTWKRVRTEPPRPACTGCGRRMKLTRETAVAAIYVCQSCKASRAEAV